VLAHDLHRRDQVAPGVGFQHVAPRAGVDDLADRLLRLMHGQDEDFAARHRLEDLARGIEPVQLRHADVEDHDVRDQSLRLLDRLSAGHRLAADVPSRLACQQGAHPAAHDLVIVCH
jgi:hypothetical protein